MEQERGAWGLNFAQTEAGLRLSTGRVIRNAYRLLLQVNLGRRAATSRAADSSAHSDGPSGLTLRRLSSFAP